MVGVLRKMDESETLEEQINMLEIDVDNGLIDIRELKRENEYLKEQVKQLKIIESKNWNKKTPDINTTVLIQHHLGNDRNHDVACYLGRDKQGNDRYMLSDRTEIFKGNVVKWRILG